MLEMKNIVKSFFGVTVVKNVDFSVVAGEVHALLGENGAGKSTLMNVLGGVHECDSGTIRFDDQSLVKLTPLLAQATGIAFVHQELNLFNDLLVWENIFLKQEKVNRFGYLNKRQMIEETEKLFASFAISLSPTARVEDLTTAQKQMLEIAKALRQNAKLFILDEPTTALSGSEIDHLFKIITRLKKEGKSFIFISHKMPEVFTLCDSYTVLRNGNLIATGNVTNTTPEDITRHMVGESYDNSEAYELRKLGDAVVEFDKLSGVGFQNLSLSVKKGEIFGLTGLQGAGCSEVMQTLFGALRPNSGAIKLLGEDYQVTNIRHAMRKKIGMVPANRKENSIIRDMNLIDNSALSRNILTSKQPFVNRKGDMERYQEMEKKLNIKSGKWTNLITSLSGGNQQKVILARLLNTDADVLLLDNPTQGIDVGAKAEIYRLIVELTKLGKTIIINTLEIPEIQQIADRCAVFYHGEHLVTLNRADITEENVMLYATGASRM